MARADALADLWRYLDEHRGRKASATLVEHWLHEQAESNGRISPDLLYALSEKRSMWQDGQFLTPRPLAAFVAQVAALSDAETVLDPTCGSGLLLRAIAESTGANTIHGIDINSTAVERARAIVGEGSTIFEADALSERADILDSYDLIVADPPLGMRLTKQQQVSGLAFKPSTDFGHALTVWACDHLTENGRALVIVSPAFFASRQAKKLHTAIERKGCSIRSVIHLPGGTLNSAGINTYLVHLQRGEQRKIFVAQYSNDSEHQERLIAGFKSRKAGPKPSFGRLCSLEDFSGFPSMAARERVKRLAKSAGWKSIPASTVITEFRNLGQKSGESLEPGPSSCYLRIIGRPLAVLDSDELLESGRLREQNVVHLQLDPEIVDPRFMVHWFNSSEVGRSTLAAVARGTTIPRLDLQVLLQSEFHLPPLEDQLKMIDGAAHLQGIRAAADELETALWAGTEEVDGILESILTINQEERFRDWIDSLPFPLASILWRYHASGGSAQLRYPILLDFFEATAAFMATVHLSAFMSSDFLWSRHGWKINQKLMEQRLSLERATFGSWKLVNEYLSAQCGKLVGDPESASVLRSIYGTPSERILSMLSSPELRGLLQEANQIRNDWIGHAGAVGKDQAEQIQDSLMELVHVLRRVFGRSWLNFELVQPSSGRFRGGIHRYNAKRLMGTRSAPFETVQIESPQPLESDELYLFDEMSQSGLRLEPFVRVIPSPEKKANACFIFNRKEADQLRFVSYHFEEESEISTTFPGVERAFERWHVYDEVSQS